MPLSLVIGVIVVGLALLTLVVLGACFLNARADANLPDLNE